MSRKKLLVLATLFFSMFGFGSLQAAPVDINSADAPTLAASLNGVGLKKAAAIVDFRDQNGDFKAINDLARVKGIGERTVMKNREDIALNAEQLKKMRTATPALKVTKTQKTAGK
ncbi:MAG: hypothetical protein HKN88_03860 [Gammaproteobacteria bacterium]|nr:helix-hairpin-helix domain-containing protein [Gammaproteobacteria bacterium]NNC97189.1 hypothetical protein [Gammaproteobacteria bacterium]NNM14501.1 hypothetical protein [Gammaproteobacteria bacterium]